MRLSQLKYHDDRSMLSAREHFENAQKLKTLKVYLLVEVIAVVLIAYLATNLS